MINALTRLTSQFRADRRGVTALEYGLLASLIALAIIASVNTFATDLGTLFTTVGGKL